MEFFFLILFFFSCCLLLSCLSDSEFPENSVSFNFVSFIFIWFSICLEFLSCKWFCCRSSIRHCNPSPFTFWSSLIYIYNSPPLRFCAHYNRNNLGSLTCVCSCMCYHKRMESWANLWVFTLETDQNKAWSCPFFVLSSFVFVVSTSASPSTYYQ